MKDGDAPLQRKCCTIPQLFEFTEVCPSSTQLSVQLTFYPRICKTTVPKYDLRSVSGMAAPGTYFVSRSNYELEHHFLIDFVHFRISYQIAIRRPEKDSCCSLLFQCKSANTLQSTSLPTYSCSLLHHLLCNAPSCLLPVCCHMWSSLFCFCHT